MSAPRSPGDGSAGDREVVSAATAEHRTVPRTAVEAADLADQYDRMHRLADLFDSAGEEMRRRAGLGRDVIASPAFVDSAPVAPATHRQAEDDVRRATLGPAGLEARAVELDTDAVVLRATVRTYQWIDDLQAAAYQTLGTVAGRAVGHLAPQVELGGAVVSAGLIETGGLDRDEVAAFLAELAEDNPELLEHVTSGGGGLLDGLQMRAALTPGAVGDDGGACAAGGLRAIGVETMSHDFASALRDVAGSLADEAADGSPDAPAGVEPERGEGDESEAGPPRGLGDLMARLVDAAVPVRVQQAGPGRFVAYLAGPDVGDGRRLRLVTGDETSYAASVVTALGRAVAGQTTGPARVMLVGVRQGARVAAELAARGAPPAGPDGEPAWLVEQVVTAGSPAAHVPRLPPTTRMLSLEDRGDPVAILGSLVSAGDEQRTTLVFDVAGTSGPPYVQGARLADAHPEVAVELERLRGLGYLAG